MVYWVPPRTSVRPTTSEPRPSRSAQRRSLITVTGGRSGCSSSRVSGRPSATGMSSTSKMVPDARTIVSCAGSPVPVRLVVRQSISAIAANVVDWRRHSSKCRALAGTEEYR